MKQQRFGLRVCQCGGRAAWQAVKERTRGRPTAQAERLACPLCGNATAPASSRERLAGEWNSAGWCGQGPSARVYEPFGPEWRAMTMRMKKPDLVTLLADQCRGGLAMEKTVREQRAVIDKLQVWRTRRELAAVIDRLVQRGVVAKADAAGAKRKLMANG